MVSYNGHKYYDMCYECGIKVYREARTDALNGIGVRMGTCPECKTKKVGIIPGRDWAYRAGEFNKVL